MRLMLADDNATLLVFPETDQEGETLGKLTAQRPLGDQATGIACHPETGEYGAFFRLQSA